MVWSMLLLLLAVRGQLTSDEVFRGYEINQLRSFRKDDAPHYMGCKERPLVVFLIGSYQYPDETSDMQTVLLRKRQLQVPTQCLENRKIYSLVFGSDQNYELLISQRPKTIAQHLMNTLPHQYEMVIDWQYPVTKRTPKEIAASQTFLKDLLEALPNEPTIRMPASSLCYINPQDSIEYATGINKIRTLIFQMHGSGYRTYEDFFTRTSYPDEGQRYKEVCPRYPSLAKLKQSVPEKTIIMSVTLKPYVQGYSSQFETWLEQALAEGITINQVFYDDYPANAYKL